MPINPAAFAAADVLEVPVSRITADPGQPRLAFDGEAVERLARSLVEHGQIQPIAVRPDAEPGRYVIVSGERRWRAAVAAGLPTITAVVMNFGAALDGLDRARIFELQLVENLGREELNPIEQAEGFQYLMEAHGLSGRQLAKRLQVTQSTVSRALALLNLPPEARAAIAEGAIAPNVAREIAREVDPDRRDALARRAVTEGLTTDEAREAVGRPKRARRAPKLPNEANRSAPDGASSGVVTRSFDTSYGRVTFEVAAPGGFYELTGALVEVSEALMTEQDEELAAGAD